MKNIQFCMKNIAGTVSYWYQVKEQLKSTLQQQYGALNLPCVELDLQEFHALFSNVNTDYLEFKSNVKQHSHILDWFFTERIGVFVKLCLHIILAVEWHWHCFKYAVFRGAIHCDGLVI